MCDGPQQLSFEQDHSRVVGCTEAERALGDRVEDRLLVGRRARDRTQDGGERGLSIERRLRLVEEAHVLDGQRGLFREGLDEGCLAAREWPNLGATQIDRTYRDAVTKERDCEHASGA